MGQPDANTIHNLQSLQRPGLPVSEQRRLHRRQRSDIRYLLQRHLDWTDHVPTRSTAAQDIRGHVRRVSQHLRQSRRLRWSVVVSEQLLAVRLGHWRTVAERQYRCETHQACMSFRLLPGTLRFLHCVGSTCMPCSRLSPCMLTRVATRYLRVGIASCRQCSRQNDTTYVHCRAGRGRETVSTLGHLRRGGVSNRNSASPILSRINTATFPRLRLALSTGLPTFEISHLAGSLPWVLYRTSKSRCPPKGSPSSASALKADPTARVDAVESDYVTGRITKD